MNEKIGIADIIDMMIRRWWIWTICAIVCSIGAFIYTQVFVEPLYRSDGTLYVNAQRKQDIDITQGDMTSSQALVKTYKEILSRRTFLSQIAADLDGKYSAGALKGMISYGAVNDTQIMEIKVVGRDPEDVYEICHSVLTHAPDELIRVINAGSVKILDDGQVPTAPFSPNVKQNSLIALLVGIALGAGIILLLELFDTRIKSREDISKKFPEPLLGEIPAFMQVEEVGADK
ncbi:MAG: hypothetical protein IK057_04405 [Clostridia bacterium]|nr:hypothetical protein [Clostridia bacterium]